MSHFKLILYVIIIIITLLLSCLAYILLNYLCCCFVEWKIFLWLLSVRVAHTSQQQPKSQGNWWSLSLSSSKTALFRNNDHSSTFHHHHHTTHSITITTETNKKRVHFTTAQLMHLWLVSTWLIHILLPLQFFLPISFI